MAVNTIEESAKSNVPHVNNFSNARFAMTRQFKTTKYNLKILSRYNAKCVPSSKALKKSVRIAINPLLHIIVINVTYGTVIIRRKVLFIVTSVQSVESEDVMNRITATLVIAVYL